MRLIQSRSDRSAGCVPGRGGAAR